MAKGQVVHLNGLGNIIEIATQAYERGELEGLIVLMLNKDGSFEVRWSSELDFLRGQGLLATASLDIYAKASELI